MQIIKRFFKWFSNTFRRQRFIVKAAMGCLTLAILFCICSIPIAILSPSTPTPVGASKPIVDSSPQPALESTTVIALQETETVNAPQTTPIAYSLATIIAASCNIRSGPGTNYEIVGNAKQGDVFQVLGKDVTGEWIQIDYKNKSWISASLIKLEAGLSNLTIIEESTLVPLITLTSTPSIVTEWEGVFIGIPADDVLLIHPKEETTAAPEQIGTDEDGLIVRWSYPGAYLLMARRDGSCPKGNDGITCYCYRVIEITLR